MGRYSIKELERLSGIKAHTIRIWEKRYKLFEPVRTPTNIRYYSDEDLRKLLSVTLLSNNGVKISKIVSMEEQEISSAIKGIKDESIISQKRVDDLIFPMLEFDEDKFNQLFQEYSKELGLEKTFTEVIYPFLEKVGILWLSDEVSPAQEHFTTHLIRQKLSAAIEALPSVSDQAKKVILFLPEGEYHELGLLFFQFLYKKKGVRVYYFGQSVPVEQVKIASETISPNWILTYTVIRPKAGTEELIERLSICKADEIFFLENEAQHNSNLNYPSSVSGISHYSQAFLAIQ